MWRRFPAKLILQDAVGRGRYHPHRCKGRQSEAHREGSSRQYVNRRGQAAHNAEIVNGRLPAAVLGTGFAPAMKASDCKTFNENKIPFGVRYTPRGFCNGSKIWMLNPNLYSRTELSAFQKVQLSELLHDLPAEIQCYFSALFSSSFSGAKTVHQSHRPG